MSVLKVITAVACEHVAQGHNNKHVLVNVLSGSVLVPEFPATFPFALYLVVEPTVDSDTPVRVDVQLNKKTLAHAESVLPPLDDNSDVVVIALPAIPIIVEGPSEIRVVTSAEGHRNATIFRLGVRQIGTKKSGA